MVRRIVCLVVMAGMGCGRDRTGTRVDAALVPDAMGSVDLSLEAPPEARPPVGDAADASSPDAPPAADAPQADAPRDVSADAAAGADLSARDVGAPDAGADASPDASPDASAADTPPRTLVTVMFTGKVATVAGMPLGLDGTARTTPVSGSFSYDPQAPDEKPFDPKRGQFELAPTSAFTCTVMGHTVTGSTRAIAQTEDLPPDTFRFIDGPQGDAVIRRMKLDGAEAPTLKLWIAITDSTGTMLKSDALPDPFPTLDITQTPHTFSLQDSGGTLLLQLDTLVKR